MHNYVIKQLSESLSIYNITCIPSFGVYHPRRSFDKCEELLYINLKTHIENFTN